MASFNGNEDVDAQGFGDVKINQHNDVPNNNASNQESREIRPVARLVVNKDAEEYEMNHLKRGNCLIIYYSEYDKNLKDLPPRKCAEWDKDVSKSAFKKLGFEIKEYHNLKLSKLKKVLISESKADHDDEDCIAVIFMSHGGYDDKKNQQILWAFDEKFNPNLLWQYFVPSKCRSLAGKPKLFFIQACRGEKTDKGILFRGLKSMTDSPDSATEDITIEEDYSVSSYADFLKMWASYPGHYAFKSNKKGIRGSVFIHFLTKVFEEEGQKENLESLLLKVKRKVTVEYESSTDKEYLNNNKQIPYVQSTLIRHVYFTDKKSISSYGTSV